MDYFNQIRKGMEEPVGTIENDILRMIREKDIIKDIVEAVRKDNQTVELSDSEVSVESFVSKTDEDQDVVNQLQQEANHVKKHLTKMIKKRKSGERIGRQIMAGKMVLPFAVNHRKANTVIKQAKKEIDKLKLEETSSDSENEIITKALESSDEDKQSEPKDDQPKPKLKNIFAPALDKYDDDQPQPDSNGSVVPASGKHDDDQPKPKPDSNNSVRTYNFPQAPIKISRHSQEEFDRAAIRIRHEEANTRNSQRRNDAVQQRKKEVDQIMSGHSQQEFDRIAEHTRQKEERKKEAHQIMSGHSQAEFDRIAEHTRYKETNRRNQQRLRDADQQRREQQQATEVIQHDDEQIDSMVNQNTNNSSGTYISNSAGTSYFPNAPPKRAQFSDRSSQDARKRKFSDRRSQQRQKFIEHNNNDDPDKIDENEPSLKQVNRVQQVIAGGLTALKPFGMIPKIPLIKMLPKFL